MTNVHRQKRGSKWMSLHPKTPFAFHAHDSKHTVIMLITKKFVLPRQPLQAPERKTVSLRLDFCSSASRHRMLTANIDTGSHVTLGPHMHTNRRPRRHTYRFAHSIRKQTHTSSLTKGAYWSLLLSSKICPIIILIIIITNTTNNYDRICLFPRTGTHRSLA